MKLTFLLLLVFSMQITASVSMHGQVTLKMQNESIRDVFREIETQSPYRFFYNEAFADLNKRININVDDRDINSTLDELLFMSDMSYKVLDNNLVVIAPKKELQQHLVTGRVTDAETGETLPGVSIVIIGTAVGTVTDFDGNYSITVPGSEAVLEFSYVGYQAISRNVGDQREINVNMETILTALDEVVVIGYGTQIRSEITGSISSLSSKDLGKSHGTNVMEQAQGRLAGVDIIKSSGIPGAGALIRVRGNRSIRASNDPLFVIDGIPTGLNLNDFNPNDIESIEVLKDASAVAIYGSRGANGVILITTRRGREGDARINYSGSYSVNRPFENLNPMNPQQFAEYVRVANGLNPEDTSKDHEILTSVPNLQSGYDPDWFGLGYGDGLTHQHQLALDGGTENIRYYFSGSYFDEQGNVRNSSSYNRFSFRANIEAQARKNLKIGINAMGSNATQEIMRPALYGRLLDFSPLAFPYDNDGELVPYPNPRVEEINPLYHLDPNQWANESRGHRIFAGIFAEYIPFENLTYRLNIGPDISSSKTGQYMGSLLGEGRNTAASGASFQFLNTIENILTYDKILGEHALNIVGLFSMQTSRSESNNASTANLPVEEAGFYDIGSASDILGVNSSLTEWTLLSYMGRINYKLKDKYLVTIAGRADGSSRLAEEHKWAFFPSAAIGWIVSNESFYNSNFLNFLKLRTGYGEVGNTAISPYQTMGGLSSTNYAFGALPAFGFGLNVMPNPDLSWEISKSVNIGLDFAMFDNRISGMIDLYDTRTSDLILSRYLPITSGYSSILQNIGSTRNRGIEFSASSYIIQNLVGGFNWDVDLTFFSNKEEIAALLDSENDDVGNQWFIGEPINVFYSFKQAGIWQIDEAAEAALHGMMPGDIKIADVNGRDEYGRLTGQPDGKLDQDDRTVLGSTSPKWSGGITNRFSYKGFDLSILVYARQGQMIQNNLYNLGGNSWQGRFGGVNRDYWTPDNPTGDIPMPRAERSPHFHQAVQFTDGSFVKIKNINLGYSIDNDFIRRLGLGFESFRIYAVVDNPRMLTFSDFDLLDSEVYSSVGGGNALTTTNIIFGLNVNF